MSWYVVVLHVVCCDIVVGCDIVRRREGEEEREEEEEEEKEEEGGGRRRVRTLRHLSPSIAVLHLCLHRVFVFVASLLKSRARIHICAIAHNGCPLLRHAGA